MYLTMKGWFYENENYNNIYLSCFFSIKCFFKFFNGKNI